MNVFLMKKKFAAGGVIVREGEPGTEAYIIRHGYVTISKQDGDRLVELCSRGPGEIVGEMALLDERPRSATLTAQTDVELEILSRKDLKTMLVGLPEPVTLMIQQLLERLRDMNELAAINAPGT